VLRIALTGGIATGKSYVARLLVVAGLPLIDADVLARHALAPGMPALMAVRARFGDGIMAPDGTLDRARLADIVFKDAGARKELEAMIHPGVMQSILTFFEQTCSPERPMAVADIPLLYEGGFEHAFDRVIVVACPHEMQIARVMTRDQSSKEAAERRIAAQLPIEEKVRRAHYVIRTDASFEETDHQVAETLEKLRREV
jgi:dephospho-CoA kinase